MKLQTKRLQLIPLTISDLDLFFNCNTNSFVKEYLWDNQDIPIEVFKEILNEVESKFTNEKWGLWKLLRKEDDLFLGYVGLWIFNPEKQPELLYALLPEYSGKGFAHEASQRVIEYVFSELKYDHLFASMDKPNINSIKLAEKLNMKFSHIENVDDKPTLFYKIENKTT